MRIRCNPRIFTQSSPPFIKAPHPVGEKGARRKTHSTLILFRLPEIFLTADVPPVRGIGIVPRAARRLDKSLKWWRIRTGAGERGLGRSRDKETPAKSEGKNM